MGNLAFDLWVLHDELEVKLVSTEPRQGTVITAAEVFEILPQEKVTTGIDTEMINKAFDELPAIDEPGQTYIIAEGKKAQNGKDGEIHFKVDVSGAAAYRAAESEAGVDFKEATRIVSVRSGELLAEVTPPTQGEHGFNLAGKELPAKNGKPAHIKPGDGVEINADGTALTATTEGRPVYSAGTLTVSKLYEVEADVDFNTGNVRFEGHVLVNGNVQDDFTITADSVEILGVVNAATIQSKGPVTLRGGINGRDKAVVEAGGAVLAKYVNQTRIVSNDNVKVQREIVNSTIWCRGRVETEKIIGGNCLALGGMEAHYLGSEMGVSTVIEPGIDYEVRKIDEQMTELAAEIEKILRPVEPFFGDKARFRNLSDEKKAAFQEAYKRFTSLKEAYCTLAGERQALLTDEETQPVKEVIVLRMVYPDVFIRTDSCMKQFKKPLTGPVALIEDIDCSTIRAATYIVGQGVIDDEEEE